MQSEEEQRFFTNRGDQNNVIGNNQNQIDFFYDDDSMNSMNGPPQLYAHTNSKNAYRNYKDEKKLANASRIAKDWIVFSEDPVSGKVCKEHINCRSPAWIVFKYDRDRIDTVCRICGEAKRARFGNTTNLLQHISSRHPLQKQLLDAKVKEDPQYPFNVINLSPNYQVIFSENKMKVKPKGLHSQRVIYPQEEQNYVFQQFSKQASLEEYDSEPLKKRKTELREYIYPTSLQKNSSNNYPSNYSIGFVGNINQQVSQQIPYQANILDNRSHQNIHHKKSAKKGNNNRKDKNYKDKQKMKFNNLTQHQIQHQNSLQISSENNFYIPKDGLSSAYMQSYQSENNQQSQKDNQQLIQTHQRYPPIIDSLTPTQIREQIQRDRKTLEQLRANTNIQLIQVYDKGHLASFTSITKQMKNNMKKYSDSISLWYYSKPTLLDTVQGIIYTCGQGQQITPKIFAISIVLKESQQNFIAIFTAIFNKFKKQRLAWPSLSIVCSPIVIEKYYKSFINKINHQEIKSKGLLNYLRQNKQYDYVFLKEEILSGKARNLRYFMLVRSLILDVINNIRRKPCFVGFFLTSTFVERLIHLTPLNFGTASNLTQLVKKTLSFASDQNLSVYNIKKPQTSNSYKIIKLTNKTQILECESLVSTEIFQKICYTFLYSQFSLHIKNFHQITKRSKEFQIFQISQHSTFSLPHKTYFVRHGDNLWQCSCKLRKWTGIPCPHLMKVLILLKISILEYIQERWKINNGNYLIESNNNLGYTKNIINQMNTEKEENRKNISQITNKQDLFSRYAIKELQLQYAGAISEDQFMSIFWT